MGAIIPANAKQDACNVEELERVLLPDRARLKTDTSRVSVRDAAKPL